MTMNAGRLLLGLAVAVLGLAGCATLVAPEVDLDAPGWTVRTGQALWKPRGGGPTLAGELIVARHDGGDVVISFSKPPVPIFTARTAGGKWRIDFVARGRSFSGRGSGPKRFVWFRLPEILEGGPAPKSWIVERKGVGEWSLTRAKSQEKIRIVLDPSRETGRKQLRTRTAL